MMRFTSTSMHYFRQFKKTSVNTSKMQKSKNQRKKLSRTSTRITIKIKSNIFVTPSLISGCENGECRDSTCVCRQGFALDKSGKLCEPVCDPPCGKGKCTAPNTCSCNVGYELTPSGACIPKCTHGCDFGECVAPERCDCRPGFILQNTVCSPVCEKCEI